MFCPSCGQQQAPEAARFCPRCGFPQYGVMSLLNANGQWPETTGATPEISPRKRGVKQGALMLFIGALLVPMLAIIDSPEQLVARSAVICFAGGILRMLYAAIFQEGKQVAAPYIIAAPPLPVAAYTPSGQPYFAPPPAQNALLPQQTMPVGQWRQPDTREMAAPPSVTEQTTRMLKRETE